MALAQQAPERKAFFRRQPLRGVGKLFAHQAGQPAFDRRQRERLFQQFER